MIATFYLIFFGFHDVFNHLKFEFKNILDQILILDQKDK